MTHMLKKQLSMGSPSSSSGGGGALGLNRDSRVISKAHHQPPKIRIIHIFAPEIIKTDVANFRELVQRLTGKPSAEEKYSGKAKGSSKKAKRAPPEPEPEPQGGIMMGCHDHNHSKPTVSTKLEVMMMGSPSSSSDHNQTVWRSSSSSSGDHQNHNNASGGGYLTAFGDLDFDFNTVWPADCPPHLNAFGESTQLSFRG